MPKVKMNKLTVDDISEINAPDTLHLIDFRATGETLEHEIPSMFLYENLSQWLIPFNSKRKCGKYVINSPELLRDDVREDNFIVALPGKKASISLIDRLDKPVVGVNKVWTAIPHPAIDNYCKRHNLALNYCYADYLRYNDKLAQKEILRELSPEFFVITPENFENVVKRKRGYIKAARGSGGFSVLDLKTDVCEIVNRRHEITSGGVKWYYEVKAHGAPHSVQIYKHGSEYTLYGFSKQYMDGTHFVGAKILDIKAVMEDRLCNFVAETCRRIDSLIHSYTGFFGIDLMISKDSLDVLECNIRLTAATLPTLLANAIGAYRYVEYFEEVPLLSVDTADTVLVRSEYTDSAHIIRPCR